LTGHIAREARRLAALEPGGRLDPPLTLVLDEAALISPVPLDSWTADMGGRGVTILAAFQSRAQLLARWGEHAAATILNNTSAVMVFGGTRDRDDLQFWSTLTGERDERILTTDVHGRVASRTVRRVPVLAPAQIANLPGGKVLLIRRGLAPVIGRVSPAWRRRDVRAEQRLVARLAAARVEIDDGDDLDRVGEAEDRWDIPADWFTESATADGTGPAAPEDDGDAGGGDGTSGRWER
jgi:type IV secretory pathway TraG/TraD family ATPase VirD4